MAAARPDLLGELAAGAAERILARVVELSGRQLERVLLDGLARLAHQQDVVVLDRHHHDGAGVVHHLAVHDRAVGPPVVGRAQVDDRARVDLPRGDRRAQRPVAAVTTRARAASIRPSVTSSIGSRLVDRDALVGGVDVDHAVAEVDGGEAVAQEGVDVRAAAARHQAGRVAEATRARPGPCATWGSDSPSR